MTNWRDDTGRESDEAQSGGRVGENFTVMTRRDRFAMAALQGLLSHPNIQQRDESYAQASVCLADALIAALNKVNP